MDSDDDWAVPRSVEELAAPEARPCDALAIAGSDVPPAAPKKKANWKLKIPAPSKWTPADKPMWGALAAARMRESRALQLKDAVKQEGADQRKHMQVQLAMLRSRGLLMDHGCIEVKAVEGKIAIMDEGVRKKIVAPESMLAIGFSDIRTKADLSRAFKLPPATIQRLRFVVAECTLQAELVWMRTLRTHLDSKQPPRLAVFCCSMAADSTKEQLALPMHPGIASHLTRSKWHVLVSQQRFAFVMADIPSWQLVEMTRPNVPMLEDNGETIAHGLYQLPQTEEFAKLEEQCCKAATVSIPHWDFDAASPNARVAAGRRLDLAEKVAVRRGADAVVLATLSHCGNHCASLVEGDVTEVTDSSLISWMYAVALFFAMGGNFFRMIVSTNQALQSYMRMPIKSVPPVDRHGLSEEIMDLAMKNFKSFSDAAACETWSSDEDEALLKDPSLDSKAAKKFRRRRFLVKRRHREYSATWASFLCFWNGDIWSMQRDEHRPIGPHYCTSPECCKGPAGPYDLGITHQRALTTTRSLVWRSQPSKPAKGKWTKLLPALLFHMITQGLNGGLLNIMFPTAFQKMVTAEVVQLGDDLAYLLETSWHQVLGVRCKKVAAGLEGHSKFYSIIVLTLVLEPLAWLTRWWMRRSSTARRARAQRLGRPPPLCDMIWHLASPAVRVLQYLTSLLQGRASRVKLLWGRSGKYNNFQEWAASEPQLLDQFHRAVVTAASWAYSRFIHAFMMWPWPLAAVVDSRRTLEDRTDVGTQWLHAQSETLDEWFSLPLSEHVRVVGQLLDGIYFEAILLWAWSVHGTNAQVEFQHGRNRQRACADMNWATHAAISLSAEGKIRVRRQWEAGHSLEDLLTPESVGVAPADKRAKMKSGYEVFKKHKYGQLKAANEMKPICRMHKEIRAEWEAKSRTERIPFELDAAMSESADGKRRRLKREAAATAAIVAPAAAPEPASAAASSTALALREPSRPVSSSVATPVDRTGLASSSSPTATMEVSASEHAVDGQSSICPLPLSPTQLRSALGRSMDPAEPIRHACGVRKRAAEGHSPEPRPVPLSEFEKRWVDAMSNVAMSKGKTAEPPQPPCLTPTPRWADGVIPLQARAAVERQLHILADRACDGKLQRIIFLEVGLLLRGIAHRRGR